MNSLFLENKKLIIFDLDGTLIKLAVDWPLLKRTLSNIVYEIYGEEHLFTSISKCLTHIKEKQDEALLRNFFKVIEEHETRNIENSTPIEESLYFINHLDEFNVKNDVKIAIMSLNTRKAIKKALEILGITNKIDYIIGREDVRHWKPDPEGLLKILNFFNVDKSEAIFFGDMQKDMICGEKAGIESHLIGELKEIVRKKWSEEH
ncbi:MAG: HAD family hydrolase [Promethearchaeota archaeon]